jgi:hypothetical protein
MMLLLAVLLGRRLAGGLVSLRAGVGVAGGRRIAALRLGATDTEHRHGNGSSQQAFQ